jgi:hypothetical protein
MKTRRTLVVLSGVMLSVITAVMLLWPESGSQPAAPASPHQAAARPLPTEVPLPSQEVAATATPAAIAEAVAQSKPGAPATMAASQPDFGKLDAFDNWMGRWKAASPEEREGLIEEGGKLVAERRPEYRALISFDPRQAVERAITRVARQDLPEKITRQLETPVSAAGALSVVGYAPDASGKAPAGGAVQRFFEADGISYKAHVPEELKSLKTFKRTPLQGYADGGDFAVAPNAVRVLDLGEKIPAGTTVQTKCLVSGKKTQSISTGEVVTEDTPVVEIGDEKIALCEPSHAVVLADDYRNYAYASGGAASGYFVENFPGNASITIGSFRFLYMRVAFTDLPAAPESEETSRGYMNHTMRYFIENSYGKLVPTTTFTPLIFLPRTFASYKASGGAAQVYADAVQVAKGLGYDVANFESVIARCAGDLGISFAEFNGPRIYLGEGNAGMIMHEAGHLLGQNHSNYWMTSDGTAYGTGSNEEYGNSFDIMGWDCRASLLSMHYNTVSKRTLGWIQPNFFHAPTTNGQFRIYAYDQPQIEEGKRYALRVAKDSVRGYNIEYHPAYSGQLADQALVIYDGMGGNAGHLLDTTPGSPGGKNDGGIAVGRTYSDWESDQHFTVVAKNATSPPSLEVVYNRGPFPGNVAPTTGLVASATTIAVSGSVTFTATDAADANGDPLAYHWQFDDGVQGTNTSTFTRPFTTAAQVNAMLTVSDQKGGTVRRSVVINVGAHGKQVITGTATDGVNPLAGVLIKAGNQFCYSNSDGTYSLPGLSTGANTLTAVLPGYTFTPSTANPYTVIAGTNTVNWTGANATRVTLAKIADPAEGGANGNFRLTRTGSTTAALTVLVSPVGGTATKTTDYTFAPDYGTSGSYKTFTIPAGSATLDIAVAAVNDTTAEGPETITLQLASAAGYVSGGANSQVMTVGDNDSTLPLVAVTLPDPYATEGPGSADAGKFTFTRTGSTAAALNLTVAWSGTAINGTDYIALSTAVTIPAGQSSVDVIATTADDSIIEVPEDVTVTLSTSASYLRDASATTARVVITDDDTPVVTVSVPDAIASEGAQDVGSFLLTRTGDTSASLTVYYGLTGSASYGTDYASQSGQVTIPAGAISAPVVITPYDDDIGESAEAVVLSVTTFNDAYSIGSVYTGSITLTDNNDPALVSVRSGSIGTEGGANATVIFNSTGSGSGTVSVNYTVNGSATAGSDYTALTGTVSVPVGSPNDTTVNIPITNDTIVEGTETVVVTITPGAGYKAYNDSAATALVRDNDSGAERVIVSILDRVSPTESGSPAANFHFFRAVGTTGDLTVNYTVSGTATNGTDYGNLSGTCVIPAGASGVNVPVIPIDDSLAEGTETITVTVNSGAGYGVDYPLSATHEILDNDAHAFTVGFQNTSLSSSEQPGAQGEYRDLPVILSAPSADTVTVRCIAGGGDALGDGVDWAFVDAANGNMEISNANLTFPPGTTSQNLRIRVKNDGYLESGEIAVLKLEAPVNAGLTAGRGFQSVAIFDYQISSGLMTEERWNSPAVYTNNTWNTVAPDYYNALLTSFTPFKNVGDNYSRRITGQIVAPATGTYTFWIAANDAARLYLSTNSTATNKVQIATLTSGSSFQNWDANASQKSVGIQLAAGQSYYLEVQHQELTATDHVSVAWEGPGFTRRPIAITVPDDAPRFVGTLASATTRNEADGSEPWLQVVLDRPAGVTPITVNYSASGTATAGSDYTLLPGTLTFAAGEQMKPLPLAILADSIGEAPEAIVVTLSNPTGAQLGSSSTHVITLLEVGAPAIETLVTSATSAMGSGTALGTVVATPASGRGISGWQILAGNVGNAFALNAAGQLTLVTPGALPNPGGMQLVVRVTDSTGVTGDGVVNVICNALVQGVVEERWNGSTAFNSNTWTGTPAYSGSLPTFTTPQNVADSYSRRVTGYLQPTMTGNYTFWVAGDDGCRLYLSSDGSPSSKTQIAAVSSYTGFQSWDSLAGQKSAVIPLVAGQVYWLEVHHLEGGGGDHVSVAWQGPGISRQAIPASAIFPNFGTPPVPPTIALTSPVHGEELDSGDNVTLEASVAGGTIAAGAVEFYRDSTLIGSDSSAPYSVTWNNAALGNHVLTARATYNGGGVTSSGVTVSVQDLHPASDPDGDGFTTGLELALGTDPNSSASQPASLYANLRAWWKLNESSGTTAGDTTGRAQDGAVSGAAWSSGITGGALTFYGIDDGVLVGTSAAVTGTTDFSLAAWVKVAPGSPIGTVIQQREPGTSGYQGEYVLNVNSTGTVNFFIYGTSAYQFDLTTAATINDGQWHHLAAVRSGNSGKVYIDGVEAASGSGAIQALQSRAVAIGYDYRDGNKRFDGSIDDVRIYERALSVGEIDGLHDALVPNRAPSFTADPIVKAAASEDVAYTGSLAVNASDPDFGDTLTFSLISSPSWLSVATNGALSGTPGNGNVGPHNFTVRVTDAAGLSDVAVLSISVNNVNDAPVFTVNPVNLNATEDTVITGQLAATDIDAGDSKSFTLINAPTWLTVSTSGAISGTPTNAQVGNHAFTVRVTDGSGAFDEAALNITVANVNDAPVFTVDPINLNVTEDSAITGQLAATDVDAGDNKSFTLINAPAWLSVSTSGAISGTPTNAQVGTHAFTVRVTDGSGAFDEASLNITVANVNDAPVFTVDPILAASATVGSAYTGQTLAGSATDADAGSSITYALVSGPTWLSVATNGDLSGTPPSGSTGLNTFVVSATDSSSATDEAVLRINVVGLPLPWTNGDVGTGMLAGSASHSSGAFTLAGSGALGGTTDKLQFTYQTLTGDGEIIARVSALENTGNSSSVGVIIRDTMATNSKQAFVGLSNSGNYRWVRRTATGGSNTTNNMGTGIAPNTWVRLTRVGNTFTAYKSSNGSSWTTVGITTLSMATNCYIGLAVSSGSDTTLNTSQFSNVSVTP